jgi:hypothetical protein
MRSLAFFCVLSVGMPALAMDKNDVVKNAKNLPAGSFDLYDHGRLCEVLGQQKLEETLPAGTRILNGVEYRNKRGRVVGELDLVVIQNEKVVSVIEVKCMAGYSKASHKADEQLDRFSRYIGRCDKVDFSLHGKEIPCELFNNPDMELAKMSYSDARSAGFQYDLSMTRTELMAELRAFGAN